MNVKETRELIAKIPPSFRVTNSCRDCKHGGKSSFDYCKRHKFKFDELENNFENTYVDRSICDNWEAR